MNRKLLLGLALLAMVVAAPSRAAENDTPDMRPYISEMLSYTFADSDRQSDDGWGGYFGYGRPFSQYWGWELGGFYNRLPSDGNAEPAYFTDYGLNFDTMFFYSRKPSFSPYFAIGVGGIHSERKANPVFPNRVSDTDLFSHVGVGFTTLFRDWIGLRADLRYRFIDMDDSFNTGGLMEPQIRVGVQLPLGQRAQPVPEEPIVSDSDGDGVPDTEDQCPGTPRGVRVDARGCPVDSDGDGVPDYLDRCPNTPRGVTVDRNGCPVQESLNRKFEDVNFGFDRFDLTDYAKVTLDKTAAEINELARKYPNLRVDIDGHTDSIGTDAYNQGLGQRRAQRVKDYLVRKGVDGGRITTQSFGESKPIASNETAKGRLLNRRAEIRAKSE